MILAAVALVTLCSPVDGDTASCPPLGRVRLEHVDTAERFGKCAFERVMARAATEFTREFLAAPVTVEVVGHDRKWNRPLVRISRGGVDLGDALLCRGLARWWNGRRAMWCP